jgi:hypothetical protein
MSLSHNKIGKLRSQNQYKLKGAKKMRKILSCMVVLTVALIFMFPFKSGAVELLISGTIYVPIYRTFYHSYGSSKDAYGLTSTACLHNTDPKQAIVISAIDHYDSNGKLIKKLLFEPITVKPWSSKEISLLPGGSEDFGANLIIRWKSDQPANPPLVEVLMVGQVLNRGVSFLTQGQEIKE